MGNRNPFPIAIDTANDWLYWGEVGPDAGADQLATRGLRGFDEVNQAN
jgi:cytochrome c